MRQKFHDLHILVRLAFLNSFRDFFYRLVSPFLPPRLCRAHRGREDGRLRVRRNVILPLNK